MPCEQSHLYYKNLRPNKWHYIQLNIYSDIQSMVCFLHEYCIDSSFFMRIINVNNLIRTFPLFFKLLILLFFSICLFFFPIFLFHATLSFSISSLGFSYHKLTICIYHRFTYPSFLYRQRTCLLLFFQDESTFLIFFRFSCLF